MNLMKRIFLTSAILAALLIITAVTYSFWQFTNPRTLGKPVTVILASGTGSKAILQQLHAANLTPAWWLMAIPVRLQNTTLKAGEYEFEGTLSPVNMIAKIARGDVVIHKITLPEGWNTRQLAHALMAEEKLSGDLPTLIEGAYLPETYHFSRAEARSAVLARMKTAMDETLQKLWKIRAPDLPIHTPEQAIILASIIERETGVAAERPMVASVYINRLRAGMPLQADPTVAYGIEQAAGSAMSRPLTRADLKTDHPWNTYTRGGLPITAIANPGTASIAAALNPPATNYLYFVASGKGGHVFASSLAEHNRNVAAYRKQARARQP